MDNVVYIFPANEFSVAAENAGSELKCGIILGYDEDGEFLAYGGGILDGRQPLNKDWLWIVETFRQKLINGDYAEV
jgi:hypothetical protein